MFSAPARGSRWGEGAGVLASPERGGRRIAPEGFPAVRRIPIRMHRGEFVRFPRCPLWGKCRSSGKGGVVSNFEMLPFNEQHPLSQPVRAASSPIGEPRGPLRIRPGFHKAVSACRETPLRLAKSRLTAVARLHGACASHKSGPLGLPAIESRYDCHWQSSRF